MDLIDPTHIAFLLQDPGAAGDVANATGETADANTEFLDHVQNGIVATGALGVTAFGITETLKNIDAIGLAGFGALNKRLFKKPGLNDALKAAYGENVDALLIDQYRESNWTGKLRQTIRQGVRAGLRPENAKLLVDDLGGAVDADRLADAARYIMGAAERREDARPEDEDRHLDIIARLELAVDARIDGALACARQTYINRMRLFATLIALTIALATAILISLSDNSGGTMARNIGIALLIGLAAVPIAPIAKDLATAISQAANALRGRK